MMDLQRIANVFPSSFSQLAYKQNKIKS